MRPHHEERSAGPRDLAPPACSPGGDMASPIRPRSPGLPPRGLPHAERQGGGTPAQGERRHGHRCVGRRHLPAPLRRAPGVHARLRVGVADLSAHQRQHAACAASGRRAPPRPPPAHRCLEGGQRDVRGLAGAPWLRRHGARPGGHTRQGASATRRKGRGPTRSTGASFTPWRNHGGRRTGPAQSTRSERHSSTSSGTGRLPPLRWPRGIDPSPDNWRAGIRQRPSTLPHYPMVLHRGGFPDGS